MNSTFYNIIRINNNVNKSFVLNDSLIKTYNGTVNTNIMEMNGLKQSELIALDGYIYLEDLDLKTRNSI